jgi:hypothetical protein
VHRKFTYPAARIAVAFVVLAIFMPMLTWGYFSEAMRTEELVPKLVTGGIGLLISLSLAALLVRAIKTMMGTVNVVVTEQLLIVHDTFRTREIRWGDIAEFGTDKRACFYDRRFPRAFFVKGRGQPHQRIQICTEDLNNLREFIDLVFLKAATARFVIVENVAWIPFTKEVEVLPWAQHNKSFLRN